MFCRGRFPVKAESILVAVTSRSALGPKQLNAQRVARVLVFCSQRAKLIASHSVSGLQIRGAMHRHSIRYFHKVARC
jgi:hypothetical protein